MDRIHRQRSHTISEDVQGVNVESNKTSNHVSKEINTNNRSSLPPGIINFVFRFSFTLHFLGSPPKSVNTSTSKSWMKLFSNHHTKQ